MSILTEKINGKLIDIEINSTNLASASYNTENEDLLVTFKNGAIYEYNNIPWSKFTKLRLAESQGKYFNEHIAKGHTYKKVK